MKIIHIIYDSLGNPWLNGGGAVRTHEMYKRISTSHEVIVYCGHYPNAPDYIDGVAYKHIGFSSNYLVSRITFILSIYPKILFTKADIYIEDIGFPFPLLISKLKKRTLASIQFIPNEAYAQKRGKAGSLVKTLNKRMLRYYQNFVTVSEFAAEHIKNNNKNGKISVIPNGVQIPADIKNECKEKYIAYLGRIDIVGKGLDTLIKAISILKERGTNLKIKIAGSGEESEVKELNEMITRHKLESQVELVGRIDKEARHNFLKNCYFLVFPSQSETFGLSALEAFVYGKPAIVSSVGGLKEMIKKSSAGLTFDSQNYEQLADQIRSLYFNEAQVKGLGEKGRQFAENFDWNVLANQYESLLTKYAYE